MNFNPLVHEVDEFNNPVYKEDGYPKNRSNWQKLARDSFDRKFNLSIHEGTEKTPRLNADGFIEIRRREAKRKAMGVQKRVEAVIDMCRQRDGPGYAYYGMNDDAGRMEKFKSHDWEQCQDEKGVVKIKVGRSRENDTTMFVMRKPIEWYEADQREKVRRNEEIVADKRQPAPGQYVPTEVTDTPLR